jgi:hypothetical protein
MAQKLKVNLDTTQSLTTKQITNLTSSQSSYYPTIRPIRIKAPVIPPILPSFNLGGGMLEPKKKLKISQINPISKYSASLGAAAFQKKGIKITQAQLNKLNKSTFSGFETRGLLEIVPDKDAQRAIRKLNI